MSLQPRMDKSQPASRLSNGAFPYVPVRAQRRNGTDVWSGTGWKPIARTEGFEVDQEMMICQMRAVPAGCHHCVAVKSRPIPQPIIWPTE